MNTRKRNPEKPLTAVHLEVIELLLSAKLSRNAIAAQVGISGKRLIRMFENPVFMAELRRQQDAVSKQTIARLTEIADQAAIELGKIIGSRKTTSRVKVKAIQVALREKARARETDDLADRVSQLEEEFGEGGGRSGESAAGEQSPTP